MSLPQADPWLSRRLSFVRLSEYRFSSENPNVVHMSVKPAELLEDDEAGKGKSSSSGGRNNEGGSGCCVIL